LHLLKALARLACMGSTQAEPTVSPHSRVPPALHSRAIADLRFIRDTMASVSAYTAFSGWGLTAVGAGALVAGMVATRQQHLEGRLLVWLADALVSIVVGVLASVLKARSAGQPLWAGPIRKFSLSFAPAILAGAVLTVVLLSTDFARLLPGIWLLLYGTGLASAGAFSARIIPIIGVGFFALGVLTLASAPALANALLMAGFGGLHVLLGLVIARRHGG
jgi:hypothetical protein